MIILKSINADRLGVSHNLKLERDPCPRLGGKGRHLLQWMLMIKGFGNKSKQHHTFACGEWVGDVGELSQKYRTTGAMGRGQLYVGKCTEYLQI